MQEIPFGTFMLKIDETIDTIVDDGGEKILLCSRANLNTYAFLTYHPENDELEINGRWSVNTKIQGKVVTLSVEGY